MKLSKITYHNEQRIKVDFAFDAVAIAKLKQIDDVRWSQTLKAWHLPDTKEVLSQLEILFPDVETTKTELRNPVPFVLKETSSKHEEYELKTTASIGQPAQVNMIVTSKRIFVKLPKNDTDTQFLSSFKYVHWDNNNHQWIIPNYGKNFDLLTSYFQNRTVVISEQSDKTQSIDNDYLFGWPTHKRTYQLKDKRHRQQPYANPHFTIER
ncbi:MAG TPA: hypothetical protein VJ856_00280, partial [Paludibacteraceae bacterium]|nr:hypothetical protein [Paludibacteraceae bacterium]